MLKNLLMLSVVLLSFSSINQAEAANDVFVCKCLSKGSGVDNAANEKICSYSCNCTGYNKNESPKANILVNVDRVATSARSRDTWDSGSSICHGQYAYKSNLGDPNWKIQVRFSPFIINSYADSEVTYEEADQSVEVAIGVHYYLKRTPKAPEIVQAIRNQI